MNGISVDPDFRGKGVGTQLFSSLMELARAREYSTIRLDVINTNPGAKRLNSRLGFIEKCTEHFEFLHGLLGFGSSTTITYTL